jgi:hypothetical protein
MSDGIHLNKESLDKVVDQVIQSVEEHFVLKKRGPKEKTGPVDKKPRFSSSSFEGGRGAGAAGSRGKGRARRRAHFQLVRAVLAPRRRCMDLKLRKHLCGWNRLV